MTDCPRCGSDSNYTEETNIDGDGYTEWRDMKCSKCKFKWWQVWKFVAWNYDGNNENEYAPDEIPPDFERRRRADEVIR